MLTWAAKEESGRGSRMYPCIEYIHKDDQLLSWIITDYMLLYNRILSYTSLRKSFVINFSVSHRSYLINFPYLLFSSAL